MNDITEQPSAMPPAAALDRPRAPVPIGVRIMLDEKLYARVEAIAERMSKAQGITPGHLLGKKEACFFVTTAALNWQLDPMYVAQKTYQTPGSPDRPGQVGYMGVLIGAIIEQSGRIEPGTGGLRFEHTGDWSVIDAKGHEVRESTKRTDSEGKAKTYAAITWTHADAVRSKAGITVRARLRGERQDREFSMYLSQAYPLNSTLWAQDPRLQMIYLATRRFANVCMPSVLGGFADPLNEAPMVERVIEPEPEPEQPREAIRMPAPKSEAPAPKSSDAPASSDAGAAPTESKALTPQQCAIVRARMKQYKVDEPEIEAHFGQPLERLDFDRFTDVMAFVSG